MAKPQKAPYRGALGLGWAQPRRPNKETSCPFGSPHPLSGGQSSCISDANGRWRGGGSGNAQEAGVQVLRIPDTTPTTGSGNTEPTAGLSVPAWRAQVGPQLHWAFLSVVINGPCIESMTGSNWHIGRKETLWKGSEPRAVGASPWLCSLSRLMPVHKIDI